MMADLGIVTVDLGSANSHCFDDQIKVDGQCIAFASEPWTSRIVAALPTPRAEIGDDTSFSARELLAAMLLEHDAGGITLTRLGDVRRFLAATPDAASVTPDVGEPEEAAIRVKEYLAEYTGFGTDEGDGRVCGCYGGNWIYLDPFEIAQAALGTAASHTENAKGGVMSQDAAKVAEIAKGLDEPRREFLDAVFAGASLGVADRAADKVRQSLRRNGLVVVLKNPRRWAATDLGLAVRAHLQEHP